MHGPHISIKDFFGALQETGEFADEFGVISPEVYQAAGELWPQAETLVHLKLRDSPTGMRLMLKAAATVSRKRREQPDQIRDLKAYLWTTFKHFISDEINKENRYLPEEYGDPPSGYVYIPPVTLKDQVATEGVTQQNEATDAILVAVREAAMALRERARIYAIATLHSEEMRHGLFARAVAMLYQQLKDRPEPFPPIASLQDRLFHIYKILIEIELEEKEREGRLLEEIAPIRPISVGLLSAPTAFNIILKLKLLLVCFARWAGWLYFVDEHLLDDYIRHQKEQVKLAR